MRYRCAACQREFPEVGFCPFDGRPLDAVAEQPTLAVEPDLAASADTLSPADTAPLAARPRRMRAVSAVAGPGEALAALRTPQPTIYDQLVGQTLDGRYFVERKLGEGGMGVVFAARHAVIERPLAIKVLKREVMRDKATIERFVQEARAASRIGHPNIIDVTDFGTTPEGMTYSVMELVDGVTLGRALAQGGPMPPLRAVRIAAQIARALGAAHDKHIIHRDLKPENVFLLDRDGRPDFVKIVDFGIAKVQAPEGKVAPHLTAAGAVFGTPQYMAPEQASGRGEIDHRIDIYALGTILYELVCGRTPHKSESAIRTIAMQLVEPIVPPSELRPDLAIPPPLEAVIMKALAKQRDERYPTMAELTEALDGLAAWLEGAGALPPQPPGADAAAPAAPAGPRRNKPATRPLFEPEFVAGGPISLQVFDEVPAAAPRRRPWPLAAIGLVVAGAVVLVVALHRGGGAARPPGDAAAPPPAPAQVAAAADAGAAGLTASIADAAAPARRADAGAHPAVHRAPPVRAVAAPARHAGTVTVEILTRPGDADVFVGETFRGPSGTHLAEPYGTKLDVECRAPHRRGRVHVVFDGSRTAVMCTATRIKMCVDGIKNPYDDCEPGPAMPPASGPVTHPTP